MAAYVGTALVLAMGGPLLARSQWHSGPQLHTLLEVSAHLVALFVAIIAFVRFYTRPTTTFLFVGTAFLGTSLLDGYHAVVTSTWAHSVFALSGDESLVAWSWLSSRLFLSAYLWVGYLLWRRETEYGGQAAWSPRAIYGSAFALTFASFLFFAVVRLPAAYFPELATHRPQDLLPGLFFVLALAGYLRRGGWKADPFEHAMVLSLIVAAASQIGYMAWAASNYDAMFDAAHVLKNLSYVAVLVGLLTEAFHVYRSEREQAASIRRVNAQLHREIIERRRIETEREQLEQQLRQAQKLEAVGQLAGGIAHDFNNVLTAITGYAQLALRSLPADDPLSADLRSIVACSDRGARLVQHLVAFSRRQTLRRSVFNLSPLVREAAGLVERLISEQIELSIATAPRIGNVEADAHQIEQVLLNLVVNARDAMPNGGKLTIATATEQLDEPTARRLGADAPGTYAVLSVQDTGIGMDEPTRQRVFEPFFTTKEVGKGTGLGLATAYGIVRQHGGAIVVDSAPGRGTHFRVYLPCVAEEVSEERIADDAALAPSDGAETVLLVEDEEMVRDVAVRFLREHGYTVHTASHAGEAEQLYARHHDEIDLLVTDIIMPGLNGRELYFRLAMIDARLKVLFMSGYADQAFGEGESARLGQFFIQKPFTPQELLARIRLLLDA